jgi:hypothetical protein
LQDIKRTLSLERLESRDCPSGQLPHSFTGNQYEATFHAAPLAGELPGDKLVAIETV